jgi:hypothetical protein
MFFFSIFSETSPIDLFGRDIGRIIARKSFFLRDPRLHSVKKGKSIEIVPHAQRRSILSRFIQGVGCNADGSIPTLLGIVHQSQFP